MDNEKSQTDDASAKRVKVEPQTTTINSNSSALPSDVSITNKINNDTSLPTIPTDKNLNNTTTTTTAAAAATDGNRNSTTTTTPQPPAKKKRGRKAGSTNKKKSKTSQAVAKEKPSERKANIPNSSDSITSTTAGSTTATKAISGTVTVSPSMDKNNKGLRHFSMKVCQKVQAKGSTNYNEVADELVEECGASSGSVGGNRNDVGSGYDTKNIRRRVYDALNVLMAMDIISKDKKEIKWIGLPTNAAQECLHLQQELHIREDRIAKKKALLHDLIVQQVAFKNLVARNTEIESRKGCKPDSSELIQLPYIIVNTNKQTQIDCEMADDASEYFFKFSKPFEVHDETEVLKRMKLSMELESKNCPWSQWDSINKLVPSSVHPYLREMLVVEDSENNNTNTNKSA